MLNGATLLQLNHDPRTRLTEASLIKVKARVALVCIRGTGYGPKYRRPRGHPPTRGPEDDETKTMTVARPHHVCVPLSERRQHRPARSTCADVLGMRSSPLGTDMVGKSRNMSADMLFMPGLMALMPPTICCVRSQSVRDLVTERSQAVPRRTVAVWLRALAL